VALPCSATAAAMLEEMVLTCSMVPAMLLIASTASLVAAWM
jgi:hypothetical protein